MLELLARYFVRRLQQSLGDPSNFGRVFAQLFVDAVAALVSQCLALRRVFGCSVIPKHLPHVAKVERCLGGTSWRRERIFRSEPSEAKCNSARNIDVHVLGAGRIHVAAFVLKVEVDAAHWHAERPCDDGVTSLMIGGLLEVCGRHGLVSPFVVPPPPAAVKRLSFDWVARAAFGAPLNPPPALGSRRRVVFDYRLRAVAN